MKNKSIIISMLLIWALLFGCTPNQQSHISQQSLELIQQADAIEDWKKTVKKTDECSSSNGCHWFAERFLDKNWKVCCVQHDFDYREGSKYGITKTQADYELWECVYASGHPYVANIIYTAVDWFGQSSWQEHEQPRN